MSSVPGYNGYRDKENRRESDKRIREHIAARLGQLAVQVERVGADLADKRDIMAVGPVDAAAKSIRFLQNQIATATYGYGGLNSDRDVDANALDQISQFDSDLLERVETLSPIVAQLSAATDQAGRESALDAIHNGVDGIQTRFDERTNVVQTGRPSAPSSATSPLTVLEPESTKPLPPPAFNLKKGDALAVGGANFLVDAVIDIEGDQPMRLFRIDVAPERWLIVNERFAADTTAGAITESGDGATANGEALTPHGRGTATATVSGLGGSSGKQSVSYRVYGGATANGLFAMGLTWPAASLTLVGRGIHVDDIEIFGQPT